MSMKGLTIKKCKRVTRSDGLALVLYEICSFWHRSTEKIKGQKVITCVMASMAEELTMNARVLRRHLERLEGLGMIHRRVVQTSRRGSARAAVWPTKKLIQLFAENDLDDIPTPDNEYMGPLYNQSGDPCTISPGTPDNEYRGLIYSSSYPQHEPKQGPLASASPLNSGPSFESGEEGPIPVDKEVADVKNGIIGMGTPKPTSKNPLVPKEDRPRDLWFAFVTARAAATGAKTISPPPTGKQLGQARQILDVCRELGQDPTAVVRHACANWKAFMGWADKKAQFYPLDEPDFGLLRTLLDLAVRFYDEQAPKTATAETGPVSKIDSIIAAAKAKKAGGHG